MSRTTPPIVSHIVCQVTTELLVEKRDVQKLWSQSEQESVAATGHVHRDVCPEDPNTCWRYDVRYLCKAHKWTMSITQW
jgi:hypothetical protein